MKKLLLSTIVIILVLSLALSLTACSGLFSGFESLISGETDEPLVRDDSKGDSDEPEDSQPEHGDNGSSGENGILDLFGSDWPENEYTKILPKPDFNMIGANEDEDGFTVAFINVDADAIKAYAGKLKEKGFTVDAEEDEQEVLGMTIYSYKADNNDGYHVEVSFAVGTSGLSVTKN